MDLAKDAPTCWSNCCLRMPHSVIKRTLRRHANAAGLDLLLRPIHFIRSIALNALYSVNPVGY